MATPYIGEIMIVPYNFAMVGWAFCDGSLMAISQNEALYNLIGTTYGGDGQTTFALPNLQSRVPMHIGSNGVDNYVIGQLGGVEAVTLNLSQIPNHSHEVQATQSQASSVNFAGNYPALAARKVYGPAGTNTLAGSAIGSAGGSLPHDNRQPYLGINYVISLYGIFPSQN